MKLGKEGLSTTQPSKLALMMVTMLTAAIAAAGTIEIKPITDDADTGIDSSITYTHALDFGNGDPGTPITVNGVTFAEVAATGVFPTPAGASQTVGTGSTDIPSANGGWEPWTNVSGNFKKVQKDMLSGGAGTHVTLTGLTPGETYKVRFYHMAWGWNRQEVWSGANRETQLGFITDGVSTDMGSAEDTFTFNEDNAADPNYTENLDVPQRVRSLDYTYKLPAGVTTLRVAVNHISGNYHMYALTNEVVPLTVTLNDPADNQAYESGNPIVASADVIGGTPPYTVEFFVDGVSAGTATTTDPYTLDLGALADGTYDIYATLTDSTTPTALTDTSPTHTFTVASSVSTTTTLASSGSPSTYGTGSVTATVLAGDASTLSGGTIQFFADANPLGAPVPVDTSTGEATYEIGALGVGTRSITADYSGDGIYNPSSASSISQVVNQAVLTVQATDLFRPTDVPNVDPLPYTITGFQNDEDLGSSGVTGEPVLTTTATTGSPVGDYPISCALGDLAATNYSFTLVDGTLTIADVADTFSINFFVGPAWPYGGLNSGGPDFAQQVENLKVQEGMPAGFDDWLTNGWLNYLVPWAPGAPQAPVALTSNRGSSATFQFKDCRNGWTYSGGARSTLIGDGNGHMMDGHVNATLEGESNKFDMEVTDIPFPIYDVIFYLGANQAQYGDGTGVIVFNGGAERAFTLENQAFDGTFTEMVDDTTPGNYVVFEGVTGSSFTTQVWGTGPSGFNHIGPFGLQIRAASSDYSTWAENYPGADLSDPSGDFDGDGVSNDDERLFGLDPTDASSVNPISILLDPSAETLSFTRRDDALTGKFCRVETSTDLVTWMTDSGAVLTAGPPDGQGIEEVLVQLSPALFTASKLFVRVVQDDGEVFLSETFEDDDNGGFTFVTTGGVGTTDWVWGEPNSASPGGSVTGGNGGSLKCWGTDISNPGYYTDVAETKLRSPVIDLTGVDAAELVFAEALDLQGAPNDSAVVNIIDDTTDTVIVPNIYSADDSGETSEAEWMVVDPIAIPAAALGQAIRIEWSFTGTDGIVQQYLGWYIDDVTVRQVQP